MIDLNLIVLYVKDTGASSAFYKDLLRQPIVQSSPQFAILPLGSKAMLGLWQRENVEPHAGEEVGGSEIVLSVADADAVRATHDDWKARGLRIAQAPTAMPFGHTFVALDPDGHRLRVLAPSA